MPSVHYAHMADQSELPLDEESRSQVLERFGKDFSEGKKETVSRETKPADTSDKPGAGKTELPATGKDAGSGGSDAGTVQRTAPEPFAGFNDLKPEQQAYFRSLAGERDQYKSNYAGLLGKVPTLQRELEALRRSSAQPQTQAREASIAAKLEKFEQYKQRFPEDAEAIEEALSAIRAEVNQTKPLAETVAQLQARLEGYERERAVGQTAQHVDQLNREHPAWRRIAGWEDDAGNPVPKESQKWHPWFSAWKSNLPPEIQQDYDTKLSQPNAVLIGHVLNHFERDVQVVLAQNGQTQSDSPGTNVTQQRTEALKDVSPRPSKTGSEPAQTNMNGNVNGSDRAAVLAQFYDQFKSGAKF